MQTPHPQPVDEQSHSVVPLDVCGVIGYPCAVMGGSPGVFELEKGVAGH